MKKIAMFIAFQGFRDEEYKEPKKLLQAAGHKVDTVFTATGEARGKFCRLGDCRLGDGFRYLDNFF